MAHKKCLEYLMASDVLLLLITSKENLTGKMFEYFASQKPIIAISPIDGLASKIIRSINAGTVIPPRNIELVKKTILSYYNRWRNEKLFQPLNYSDKIEKFNRKILTQRLSKIFDKVK